MKEIQRNECLMCSESLSAECKKVLLNLICTWNSLISWSMDKVVVTVKLFFEFKSVLKLFLLNKVFFHMQMRNV